ncbi:16757_t:CDS:1, partial [Cetraspora pellucida]
MNKCEDFITEPDTNTFFIYNAIDYSNNEGYFLRLHTVCSNGRKFLINIIIQDIFFDIKLNQENSILSYTKEFKPQSYEIIYKQLFDSIEKFEFIRFYFKNHNERKK